MLATARHARSSVVLPPGMLPDYYLKVSRATLLCGAALLVATVFAHGALAASIGVALATWISARAARSRPV